MQWVINRITEKPALIICFGDAEARLECLGVDGILLLIGNATDRTCIFGFSSGFLLLFNKKKTLWFLQLRSILFLAIFSMHMKYTPWFSTLSKCSQSFPFSQTTASWAFVFSRQCLKIKRPLPLRFCRTSQVSCMDEQLIVQGQVNIDPFYGMQLDTQDYSNVFYSSHDKF